jgi:biopolymer transport protein ExbD
MSEEEAFMVQSSGSTAGRRLMQALPQLLAQQRPLPLPGQVSPGQQQSQPQPQTVQVAASGAMASQQDTQGSTSSGEGVLVLLQITTSSAVAQQQLDHLLRASNDAELQTAIGIQGFISAISTPVLLASPFLCVRTSIASEVLGCHP